MSKLILVFWLFKVFIGIVTFLFIYVILNIVQVFDFSFVFILLNNFDSINFSCKILLIISLLMTFVFFYFLNLKLGAISKDYQVFSNEKLRKGRKTIRVLILAQFNTFKICLRLWDRKTLRVCIEIKRLNKITVYNLSNTHLLIFFM